MNNPFRRVLYVGILMGVLYTLISHPMKVLGSSSTYPNDPFFEELFQIGPIIPNYEAYQWALGAHRHYDAADINVIPAWEYVTGHAYLGMVDIGILTTTCTSGNLGQCQVHPGLAANFRAHLSPEEINFLAPANGHGMHVMGIMAGVTNENSGTVGVCQECSTLMKKLPGNLGNAGGDVMELIQSGVQAINMSWGDTSDLFNLTPVIEGLAAERDVVLVAAAGNTGINSLDFPASHQDVIGVGGSGYDGSRWNDTGNCIDPNECASNYSNSMVVAPAKRILSAWEFNENYTNFLCGDALHAPFGSPNSLVQGPVHANASATDGYGLCTGTSMAAPLVTGIVGLIRSVNPLLSRTAVKDIIQNTTDNPANATDIGYGLVNAETAVKASLGTVNGSVIRNRLTPLFVLYSNTATDHFYTTVPQMAMSAIQDDPRWTYSSTTSPYGNAPSAPYAAKAGIPAVAGYSLPDGSTTPGASVYIFTTDFNPVSLDHTLMPLYRLSYISGTDRDFSYATDVNDFTYFTSAHYFVDGIEGYIYPPTISRPPGTVKLYRMYHPGNNDYAIFPQTQLAQMQAAGYVAPENGLSDWIGYVYLNVDSDLDQLIDGFELLLGTNTTQVDSDWDGLNDGQEVLQYPYTDPLVNNPNLITNPGFENGTVTPFINNALNGTLDVEAGGANVHQGAYSLRHTATGSGSYTLPWYGSNILSIGGLDRTYHLSAWVKASQANTVVRMYIFCLDANYGNSAPYRAFEAFTIGTAWQEISLTHICTKDRSYVSVRLDNNGGNGAVVWWDDVALRAGRNYVSNPGVETLSSMPPFPVAVNGTMSVDSTQAYKGANSLRHTATGNDSYTAPWYGRHFIPYTAQSDFQFSTWVKASAASTPVQLYVFCLDANQNPVTWGHSTFTVGINWQKVTFQYTCAAAQSFASVRLDNDGGNGRIVWWDDMVFEEITP